MGYFDTIPPRGLSAASIARIQQPGWMAQREPMHSRANVDGELLLAQYSQFRSLTTRRKRALDRSNRPLTRSRTCQEPTCGQVYQAPYGDCTSIRCPACRAKRREQMERQRKQRNRSTHHANIGNTTADNGTC